MTSPSRAAGRLAVCATVAALGLASFGWSAPGRADPNNAVRPTGRAGTLVVGQPPPPLALDRVAGTEEVTLGGLAGRVVVLDFWATWCSPCRAIMPILDAMYQQHQAAGLSVVGLSPEPNGLILAHLARSPVQYTIARDVGGTTRAYGVRGIPTLVVIGRDGKVREVMVGVDAPRMRRLDTVVRQLLAESAP